MNFVQTLQDLQKKKGKDVLNFKRHASLTFEEQVNSTSIFSLIV